MSKPLSKPTPSVTAPTLSEVLILGDGRVLGHNLTPEFTALLAALNPADPQFLPRAAAVSAAQPEPSHHTCPP